MRKLLEQAAAELLAAGNPDGRRDAELLLLHTIGRDRTYLLTHPNDSLTEKQIARYRRLLERRKLSEPIQYITGEREFYGLRFVVTPDVLIPRPETEHLVEAALARIPVDLPYCIADVGTGSGAIAVALAVGRPSANITAIDISSEALHVSSKNASAHGVAPRIDFTEADLLAGTAAESFDMVVSNPPYIADAERAGLEAQVREYEPASALFAGPTGLEVYERLIPQAAQALRPNGWLLFEIGAGQDAALRRLLDGWNEVEFAADLQGIPRVAIARRPQRGRS